MSRTGLGSDGWVSRTGRGSDGWVSRTGLGSDGWVNWIELMRRVNKSGLVRQVGQTG